MQKRGDRTEQNRQVMNEIHRNIGVQIMTLTLLGKCVYPALYHQRAAAAS
jgi:hypothetical protein